MDADAGGEATRRGDRRALRAGPVLIAWVLVISIDLFFNAGLFAGLFDQAREPVLLDDSSLFARVPVAYAVLLAAVAFLAFLTDAVEPSSVRRGGLWGLVYGAVLACMSAVYTWTAIDLSGEFVASAVLVTVSQFTAAGAALAGVRSAADPASARRMVVLAAGGLLVAGIVLQNVLP